MISESECKQIVNRALHISENQFDLIKYELVPVSIEIEGFLGEYFHLVVVIKKKSFKDTEVLEYFVKCLPQKNRAQKEFVNKLGVFKREAVMYTALFSEMDKYNNSLKWHGCCYYARDDILVMEDLRKQNFQVKVNDDSVTLEHLQLVLRYMATMHANSICFEQNTGCNIGEKYSEFLPEIQIQLDRGWIRAGLKSIKFLINIHPKLQNPEMKNFLHKRFDNLIKTVPALTDTSTKFRNVFCHRDLWDKNLLFKYSKEKPLEPTECIFLDFQLSRYHPPCIDILQCIFLNTTPQDRKNSLQDYLKFYYKCLLEEGLKMGVDIAQEISWNEILESCEHVKVLPAVLGLVDLPVALLPPGYMNDIKMKDCDKYLKYISEDRNEMIAEYMEKNGNYKRLLMETTEELVAYMLEMTD